MAEKIRIQKYFTDHGILSRRRTEEEMQKGNILVNDLPVSPGDKIDPECDTVTYLGRVIDPQKAAEKQYLMLNKPRGYVTTLSDEKGRKTVESLMRGVGTRVYPVGRLDMDSDGLLLFTNDGEFANHLTHPRHEIPKIYEVTLSKAPSEEALALLRTSMVIDGYRCLPVEVTVLAENRLQMTLYEGRNRQIRKMCAIAGLKITRLSRVAIGKIKLGNLPLGTWRALSPDEVNYLFFQKKG